jgi:hypothetical protein
MGSDVEAPCGLYRWSAGVSSGGLRRTLRVQRSAVRPQEPEASGLRGDANVGWYLL